MKNNNNNADNQIKLVKHSFTGGNITMYSGINQVAKIFKRRRILDDLRKLFPTKIHNATKFTNLQVLISIIYASISGVNRMSKIANYTNDPLVKINLGLRKAINEDKISGTLKDLGEWGARKIQHYFLSKNANYLKESSLTFITLDADSTVSMVYGNQEGAEKGYNPIKKGAKSYHPLLVFASELKLLYHTWFRSGSAYTSNGICEFLKEVQSSLPDIMKTVFFRADSGFFGGDLLDLLESYKWNYLIKVKLKNLKQLLEKQTFKELKGQPTISICEFDYTTKEWNGKVRKLKAIRTVKEYVESTYLGKIEFIPVYEYACYISSYENKDANELHELYKQRATSETWIEQVKSQLLAGKTLTDDFWANDIIWQLNCFAYNFSIMLRNKHQRFKKQEHATFRDWFIKVPGRLVSCARQIELKIYANYYYKDDWIEFEKHLEMV